MVIVVESDLSFLILDFSVRMEQGTVTSLVEENGIIKGVQYKTKDGQELKSFAPLTIVCDGCFSNLRRSLCKPKVCDMVVRIQYRHFSISYFDLVLDWIDLSGFTLFLIISSHLFCGTNSIHNIL